MATELPTPKSHQEESRSEICVYESTDAIIYFVEYHIPLLEYAAHVTYVNKEPIVGIYIATPNSPFVISAPSKPKIYMRSKFIHFLQIFRVLFLASPFGTSPLDATLLFPTGFAAFRCSDISAQVSHDRAQWFEIVPLVLGWINRTLVIAGSRWLLARRSFFSSEKFQW